MSVRETHHHSLTVATTNHRLRVIRRSLVVAAAYVALAVGMPSCERHSSAHPLSVEDVRKLDTSNTKHLSFEERHGAILVTTGDKYGDAHVHTLSYEPLTKHQALELLDQKRKELEHSR